MSILNRPSDGLSSVLLVLWKTLRVMGSMPKDKLLGLCAPSSLSHHSTGFEQAQLAQKTLARWTQLGLFVQNSGTVKLSSSVRKLDPDGDPEFKAFRAAALDIVLEKSNNKDLVKAESGHSADFCFAACWVLGQDVFRFPGGAYGEVESVEMKQIKKNPFAFRNDTRWSGFKDWASFLGLGWNTKIGRTSVFSADPTDAIRSHLPSIFQKSREIPQERFFDQLSRVLPVLDRGEYRRRAEKRFEGNWRPLGNQDVSPAVTRALIRLEIEGLIKIDDRADADERVLLGRNFKPVRSVSHVQWRQEA